jgi:hypothetical protein
MAVVSTQGGSVVVTSGGKVSVGNCGTGAGGFKPGNTCAKGGGGTSRDFTDDEREAIKRYTAGGYKDLNEALREGQELTPEQKRLADSLDAVIEKAEARGCRTVRTSWACPGKSGKT